MEQKVIKTPRPWPLLIVTLLSLAAIGYGINSYSPSFAFMVGPIPVPVLGIAFLLLFAFLYSFSAFLFASALQGLLVGMLFIVYFLFRMLGLTHPLFAFLLVCLFCSLEFVIYSKK